MSWESRERSGLAVGAADIGLRTVAWSLSGELRRKWILARQTRPFSGVAPVDIDVSGQRRKWNCVEIGWPFVHELGPNGHSALNAVSGAWMCRQASTPGLAFYGSAASSGCFDWAVGAVLQTVAPWVRYGPLGAVAGAAHQKGRHPHFRWLVALRPVYTHTHSHTHNSMCSSIRPFFVDFFVVLPP